MSSVSLSRLLLRLPATTLMLLATLLHTSEAHALPRQTTTVEYHEIQAVAWPPLPTEAPYSPLDLLRRQAGNTVCGYVGGNADLPATCSPGSHCVLDSENMAVGCCPDSGSCTQGVYTGCVDKNSDPQTEVNPYVFTCSGSDVCYRNNFDGGYHQYGCGTASDLATSIATTAEGASTSLDYVETSMSLTQTASSLSEPTTIGSVSSSTSQSSSSSSTTTTSTSTTSTSSSSSTTTGPSATESPSESPSETTLPGSAPPAQEDNSDQIGAIVGGTLGGVAAVILLGLLALYMRKRARDRANKESPGIGPIGPPMTQYRGPGPVHGAAFAPLNSWHEDDDDQQPLGPYSHSYQPYGSGPYDNGNLATPPRAAPASHPPYHPTHVPVMGMGLAPVAEEPSSRHSLSDSEPSLQEIDDFSRAYSAAAIGTMEEDRIPLTPNSATTGSGGRRSSGWMNDSGETVDVGSFPIPPANNESPHSPTRSSGSSRPLWQQNRQRSRNLMWM